MRAAARASLTSQFCACVQATHTHTHSSLSPLCVCVCVCTSPRQPSGSTSCATAAERARDKHHRWCCCCCAIDVGAHNAASLFWPLPLPPGATRCVLALAQAHCSRADRALALSSVSLAGWLAGWLCRGRWRPPRIITNDARARARSSVTPRALVGGHCWRSCKGCGAGGCGAQFAREF